jgi:pyruvate,water dikinase
MSENKSMYIRWFEETTLMTFHLWVGRMFLGEMYRELTSKRVKIPNGFK